MSDQDDTVQWLRARITELENEQALTLAGQNAKYEAIKDLERELQKVAA